MTPRRSLSYEGAKAGTSLCIALFESHTKILNWHFIGLFSHIAIRVLERDLRSSELGDEGFAVGENVHQAQIIKCAQMVTPLFS